MNRSFWLPWVVLAQLFGPHPQALAFAPLDRPDPSTLGPAASAELVELGKVLFFDPRLSINDRLSCASCHNPDLGFSDGLALGLGTNDGKLGRNTPHLYNLAWGVRFFWDGRAKSLEEQALGPVLSPEEMAMDLKVLLPKLQAVPFYAQAFAKQFPQEGLTAGTVAQAIAAFERTLVVNETPYDRYLQGDKSALDPAAVRGLTLFKEKAHCAVCHEGPNLTDNGFHNLGLESPDLGRYQIDKRKILYKAFKTPGLRNIALSAPYMHDGSLGTLEAVVRFYNQGGGKGNKDLELKPLELSEREIYDLVAFLGSLTQPLGIKRPEIP